MHFLSVSVDDATAAIGFTACSDVPRVFGLNEIVLFERELTNYGGYYNTQTSSFICPVDGVYVFTIAISVDDTNMVVLVMRNDVELSATWANADTEPYNHATNMVVTECLVGDVVWPRVDNIAGTGDLPVAAPRGGLGGLQPP